LQDGAMSKGPARDEIGEVLERLIVATQLRYPAVGDLARSIRFRLFDQPLIQAARELVYEGVREHLHHLDQHPEAADYTQRVEAMAASAEPLIRLLAQRIGISSSGLEPMLEVLTRRYYKVRKLQDVRSFQLEGRQFVTGSYEMRGEQLHLISTIGDLAELPAVLAGVAGVAGDVADPANLVVDIYLSSGAPAGDPDSVAASLRNVLDGVPMLTTGRRAALEAIIAGFSPDEIVAQPWLALSRAWCAVQAGEPVDAWVDAAAAAIDVAADTAEAQAVESAIALLLAVVANKGVEQMAADAERAYRLDTSDSDFRPVACFLAGTAHEMLGNGEQAAIWLEEGTRVAVLRSVPSIYAQCQAELAIVALARDDWQAVAQHAHAALTEVLRYRLAEAAAPVAPVFAVAALSAANAGDVEQAQSHTRQALLMLASLRHVGPSIRAQSRETLARTELMLGDYDAAKILVAEAEAEARRLPDAAMLHERLRRTATLLRNRPSSSAEGSRVLSTREVEVLQLLPSHLSFDAIGERLGIGGEAVQTVAVAAYRKLGVVSRTDAVERALVLGLIESPYD